MRRAPRRGLTLVELLVSIAATAVLIVLIGITYRTVFSTAREQEPRMSARAAPATTLDALRHDLMRAFDVGRIDTRMILTQQVEQAQLQFTLQARVSGEPDLRWTRAERVEWGVARDTGRLTLYRAARPLAGPGSEEPPVTNVMMESIGRFAVQVFDGTNWYRQWPPATSNSLPRLARLELQRPLAPTSELWSLDVWIPAGTIITSAQTRAVAR